MPIKANAFLPNTLPFFYYYSPSFLSPLSSFSSILHFLSLSFFLFYFIYLSDFLFVLSTKWRSWWAICNATTLPRDGLNIPNSTSRQSLSITSIFLCALFLQPVFLPLTSSRMKYREIMTSI